MTKRLTINMPEIVYNELEVVAKKENLTVTALILQSIKRNMYLIEENRKGSKVFIDGGKGKIKEIILM